LQALLVLRGWIAGPFVGTQNPQPTPMYPNQPMYHRLSVQQIISCAMLNGCWGGSVVNAFRWMITGQPDQPQMSVHTQSNTTTSKKSDRANRKSKSKDDKMKRSHIVWSLICVVL
jgi:hypothetical protein